MLFVWSINMELKIQIGAYNYALITENDGVLRIELFTYEQPTQEMQEAGYSEQLYEKTFKIININADGNVQEISCN